MGEFCSAAEKRKKSVKKIELLQPSLPRSFTHILCLRPKKKGGKFQTLLPSEKECLESE